jgi:serine/threonine-protein kinase RsbT
VDPCTIVPIGSDADIITARQHGRAFLAQLGFSSPETTLVVTAISELARNIVLYASEGEIVLQSLEHDGRCGVMIIARDRGPGIPDDHRAAIDAGACAAGSLGLRATKRFMDEFEIMSAAGEGTTVALKKWKA